MGKEKYYRDIHSIQTEYLGIIRSHFGEVYANYVKSGKSVKKFCNEYIRQQKPILLLNGEDSFTTKILEFVDCINSFWNRNLQRLLSSVQSCGKLGFFGTEENNTSVDYERIIKQNAVFFDLVVLNDPFYKHNKYNSEIRNFIGNQVLFFESIISIISIQSYLLNENDTIAVIMPVNAVLNDGDEKKIWSRAVATSDDIAIKLFGIDYKETRLVEVLKVLIKYSDEDISRILIENDIFIDLFDARRYDIYALGSEGKRRLEEESRATFGYMNWDYIRCLMNYSTIRHILTDTVWNHATHTEAALRAGMNPIYNIYEWYPNKFYYENIPGVNPSNEYKYVCAVQKNQKLAQLVEMELDDIIRFREKNEQIKFRELFTSSMSDIIVTPDQFDKIAEMVFAKLQENLNNIKHDHSKKVGTSIWGLATSLAGFVPILSEVLGTIDAVNSANDVRKVLSGKNDIIRHLIRNKDNIFSTNDH